MKEEQSAMNKRRRGFRAYGSTCLGNPCGGHRFRLSPSTSPRAMACASVYFVPREAWCSWMDFTEIPCWRRDSMPRAAARAPEVVVMMGTPR